MDHDRVPLCANEGDVGIHQPHSEPTHIQTPTPPPHEDAPTNNIKKPVKYIQISFRGRCPCLIRLTSLNMFLTIMTVLSGTMMYITLPLLSASMVTETSTDEYPVLLLTFIWFPIFFFGLVGISKLLDPEMSLKSTVSHRTMALVGGLNSLNGLLGVYASHPARTSPQLQVILNTSSIPFTVISRYIILRKGVCRARLVCMGVVLIGLFISFEPVIWNINQPHDEGGGGGGGGQFSGYARIVWPLIFILAILPGSIGSVLIERELKRDQIESLVFQTWSQLYCTIIICLLFWTDFIPGFGAASNPAELLANLKYGFNCMYGQDTACSDAVVYAILFIISNCLTNLFVFLLVRFAEGAIYLVIVQALVAPAGALFWTLFKPDPSFHWEPVFDLATAFVLGGLVIMVPAVVLYDYFGNQEAKKEEAATHMDQYYQ